MPHICKLLGIVYVYGVYVYVYIIYRVRHIKYYRAIALKLLIISKNVSDKSFSVREKRYIKPPYFFIDRDAEANSKSSPLF